LASTNFAAFHYSQGRYGEAEQLYKRALEGHKRVLGREHPRVVTGLTELAGVYFNQGDWVRAAEFLQHSTSIIARRLSFGMQGFVPAPTKTMNNLGGEWRHEFWLLVKAASHLAGYDSAFDAQLTREIFEPAQWAVGTEAAQSLAKMAARGAGVDPELATLVRKREDLIPELQKRDALRNAALAQAPDQRNLKAEAENLDRLSAIEARIKEISETLAVKFPDYAALASPQPLSVEEVQSLLGPNEAVVLFMDTLFIDIFGPKQGPAETFIWVVTKTDIRWVRSDLDILGLGEAVGALRCGLDAAMRTNNARCAERAAQSSGEQPLSFDLARAHALYKAIFGKVGDLIKGKHLLIVPSSALTLLPFQVLVTEPPANDDYRSAAWLIRDHAITVLPAVSSLKALRRVARPSAASKPMIGFGNPLLDGPDNSYRPNARLAREKQSCPRTAWQRVAPLFGLRDGVAPIETRGGLANVSQIRQQVPLHETRDELCAVARDIGADVGEMRLGARATEREVKAMSESGELAKYRVVHFATHGAMAGELDKSSESGLILTPPDAASEEDDGYLSASEIAALKLDADWVILSACNTAAGNAADTEALSGLARAFIYAQARALLVSHWAVDSDATVKLITSAMGEIGRNRSVGRAEALRRSMLAMIDKGDPHEAHPSYWAPFIVVGEGAR
jgi:CHAT domain-containing protein